MTTTVELTARELDALGFLRRYISGVGYAPSGTRRRYVTSRRSSACR